MKRVRVTLRGSVLTEVDVGRELTIGRKPPADLVIADGEVSSVHARLRAEGERLLVTDLGSTNGTRIDGGERLAPNAEVALANGQKLMIGPAVIEVVESAKTESGPGFAQTEKTVAVGGGQMQALLVNVARFKAAQARLVVAAEHDRRVVPIETMDIVVGRDPKKAQVHIQHQSVSSAHAKIRFENGQFWVEDLKSANGTFVDGNPVAVATPVRSDQALTFGTVDCLFVHRQPESGDGGADPHAAPLVEHVVRSGKATHQQGREVLEEHRRTGAPLGLLFVSRGILGPREWSEIHRQRQVIAQFTQIAARKGPSLAKVVGIVVVALGIAALAYVFLVRRAS